MKQKSPGVAIGTVLLSITTFVTILFFAVSASLSHLNLVRQSGQREHAGNLADAALDSAIERMGDTDFTFGDNPTDRVSVMFQGLDDAEGIVTFSSIEFVDSYSTFNLESDASVPGSAGRTVPARTVHLVARGRVGDVLSWKEAIVHVPPFPDGLVASGPVDASGLLLMGVRDNVNYTGGDPQALPPQSKVPVNLFSNADQGQGNQPHAVVLSNSSHVSGSVGSPGSVDISPDTYVAGEIRPGAGRRPLPDVDVRSRIALLSQDALPISPSHGSLTLHQDWFNHAASGLNVSGDLDLNGSALTVNGPLRVGGSIKGTGVVLVDGDIRVEKGGTSVSSLDQVALASTGNVDLIASDPNSNFFQGLVYAEGNFQATDITIVGTMVINGKNGSPGSVSLDNVRFVYTPRSVTTAVSAPIGTEINSHSTAVSLTLSRNSDQTYTVDARLYATNSGEVDTPTINNPSVWSSYTDPFDNRSWPGVNVGPISPQMGQALGREMGQWADDFEVNSGIFNSGNDKANWTQHLEAEVPRLINELLRQPNTSEVVTFNLNNVLTQTNDRARILLRRPLIRP